MKKSIKADNELQRRKFILGLIRVYSVSNEGEYYKSQEFEAHPGGVNTIVLLQGKPLNC